MLKKTKITTNTNCIVNSTYTILYLIGVRPSLSIDHHSRAALDNGKGGGDYANNEITTSVYTVFQ